MKTDPRIDAYIAKSAAFAQPMMTKLRAAVHKASPEIEETLKWSSPSFIYKGKILCGFAAFKAHMAFHFWDGEAVTGKKTGEAGGMGQFGRMASMADLPSDKEVAVFVKKGMTLIEGGETRKKEAKPAKAEIPMPDDFASALANNDAASAVFDGFPPSCRREYLEWIVEAKRPETRQKRIAQTVAQCAEGKRMNWKYEKC